MAKRYDPILCMMVEDNSIKTKDATPNGWDVELWVDKKSIHVFSKAMSQSGAILEARNKYPNSTVLNVKRAVVDSAKVNDRLDDPEKNAGYTMKKEGQYFKVYKNGKLIGMKSTEEEARREAARHRAANDSAVITYNEIKSVYNLISNALMYRGNEGKMVNLLEKAQSELLSIASKTR